MAQEAGVELEGRALTLPCHLHRMPHLIAPLDRKVVVVVAAAQEGQLHWSADEKAR